MKVLVINSGSSSLKFDLVEVGEGGSTQNNRKLAHGIVDRIGHKSALKFSAESGSTLEEQISVADHREAVEQVHNWLSAASEDDRDLDPGTIQAAGHRVVHGGHRFVRPTLIDEGVLSAIEELSSLAPLHNPAAVQGIRAAGEILGPGVPMVAVFDTAFHSDIPARAAQYALPSELVERHDIRRYGFHGLAHEYMLRQYVQMAGVGAAEASIITLQLGNGCSATAIKGGKSVDTSMGFTPLEGLVMGTRSGDVDPGIIAYLAAKEKVSAREVESWLNGRSGLLGVSARSQDMRDLLAAREEDPRAALAVELFCYRARKYIGAYLAALEGADAVVFGGGIGEHAPAVRAQILEGMEWCGLRLDSQRNEATTSSQGRISADGAAIHAYVVQVDEEVLIAQYTAECIKDSS